MALSASSSTSTLRVTGSRLSSAARYDGGGVGADGVGVDSPDVVVSPFSHFAINYSR